MILMGYHLPAQEIFSILDHVTQKNNNLGAGFALALREE